jgi:biotin synthase-related radical SAM superfamily protein
MHSLATKNKKKFIRVLTPQANVAIDEETYFFFKNFSRIHTQSLTYTRQHKRLKNTKHKILLKHEIVTIITEEVLNYRMFSPN